MRSDGDGTQSRDLCYVDNVTDACVRAAKHEGKLEARRINVACSKRTSNNDIMDFLKILYPDATSATAPWRAGDVMHTHADVSLAKEVLGYEPLVEVYDGIQRTASWYDENWSWISRLKLNV
jgi:nucleoside-diphosphate-sugar epimerase